MPSRQPYRAPLFPKWHPPDDPHLGSRLEHHEAVTASHDDRLTQLEARPNISLPEIVPWARLGSLVFLLLLALVGLISPETTVRIASGWH